ncbi:MAG: sensor histidine kinase [Actinomycetota bacterium]|nr:sensor histidine kinase [Actinomycetota bacterium]
MSPSEADHARGHDKRLRILAWTLFGLTVAGFAVGATLDVVNGARSDLEAGAFFDALFMAFPIVGLVLITKLPRNPLGWLMLCIGLAWSAYPGAQYARFVAVTSAGELPGAGLALALDSPTWIVFIGLSGFLLLLFPNGRLPSGRWRWFASVCIAGMVTLFFLILVSPDQGADYGLPQVHNPLAIPSLAPILDALLPLALIAPITVVGGAVAVIRRLLHSVDPVEKRQLRWLAWAAGVIAFSYAMAFVPGAVFGAEDSSWENVLSSIAVSSFLLIPVSIGIAVLRYRLYEIDVVIRKSVVFAAMVSMIAAIYAAVVVGVGALVGSSGSPVLSAVAAAVVALVFQPARVRARHLADRLIFGQRATPYEVMASFGGQLAGTYAADDVLLRLARVLGEGVGAERASVWLSIDGVSHPVASWPTDADAAGGDDIRVVVQHEGEELGALSVTMPANDPMDPAKGELVGNLAAQTGLVLRNVRLTEELRARLVDLRAAQKRLVAAQDEERRRLERNIHDGAQQQLVALTVKARLARTLTERDPPKAAEMLTQIEAETQSALEDLRDLARGIYPPLLADKGLAAALEAQGLKSPVPVTVETDGLDRLPQEIEAAVYFSALEALQNTAKYAHASRATVTLRRSNGVLAFSVADDGAGFEPASTAYGTGLQGIADRLGALDGEVTVESSPGSGTTVTGRVPVRSGADEQEENA